MKTKDFKTLRAKNVSELEKMVPGKRLDIIKTKAALASGQEKNLKKAKNLRQELAKILTLIKEKEIVEKIEPTEKLTEKQSEKKKGK